MAAGGRGRGTVNMTSTISEQQEPSAESPDKQAAAANKLAQSHMAGKTTVIGESAGTQRRLSSWGTFTRVVVCCIDPSPFARDAFNWYLKNVWRSDDLILLTHIPETPALPNISFKKGVSLPAEDWMKLMQAMNDKTRRLQEEFEHECETRKLKYKLVGESSRNPGEGICRVAEEEKADLIVIGTRGLGAIKRALLGSVSEYVVRHANIPCIVVRSKKLP